MRRCVKMRVAIIGAVRRGGMLPLLILGLAACGQSEPVAAPDPVRPVKLIEITGSSNIIQVNIPAVIEASNTSVLTFQVGGSLDELNVEEGQEVGRGTVIARLDQRDFRNALQQAQAQYTSANSEFERAARLLEQDAISRSVFEQRLSSRDVARAALDTAQKALDDTVLRTPFAGVISSVAVEQFENVSPQQEIVTLQTVGAAEALVQMPATIVANAEQRLVPIESFISLDAAPGVLVPAEFATISTQANATTQTFATRFKFTPPDTVNILPGMTGSLMAKLEIIDPAGQNLSQLTVPISAVLEEGGDRFVWVVDTETMTVSKRQITFDREFNVGEELIVLAGLEEGETIAGAGASYLFEGMKIRPYED